LRIEFDAKGKIGKAIAHRTDLDGKHGNTVLRDLGRYYDLVERERRKIALTRAEAELICLALAVGGSPLNLTQVLPLSSWVEDFVDTMGEGLKSEMGDTLEVDLRRLRKKMRRLTDVETLAVLDAANSYMLNRRWKKKWRQWAIEDSDLVRTAAANQRKVSKRKREKT